MASRWRTFWWLLHQSLVSAYENGALGTAKGAAYSALLSFFPLLTTLVALLAHANAERVSGTVARFFFRVVPPGTQDLIQQTVFGRGERPLLLPIGGMLLSIWACSGLMATLMEGFHAAYHIPINRSAVRERAMAILLVLAAVVPVVGASALIVFGNRLQGRMMNLIGLAPAGVPLEGGLLLLGEVLRYAIALGAIILVNILIYYLGPNREQRWGDVWPGAILATLLWLLATSGFAWYARHIANYSLMYGSIGAVIALLVWMYLLSLIALIGCEFNANRERLAQALSRAASA